MPDSNAELDGIAMRGVLSICKAGLFTGGWYVEEGLDCRHWRRHGSLCAWRNRWILGRHAAAAVAWHARSSERQYTHDQNAKRHADHSPTQRRFAGHRD